MKHKRTTLYLCRHGEVEQAYLSRSYGHLDVALSPKGVEQSEALRDALGSVPLKAVYASDLRRASYAAELLAARHGLTPILTREFREIGMGDWEGKAVADLNHNYPDLVASFFAEPLDFVFPAGEAFKEFVTRITRAVASILEAHEGDVALITHAAVCRAILGRALQAPPKTWLRIHQDFGCINVVEWSGELPAIRLINYRGCINPFPDAADMP